MQTGAGSLPIPTIRQADITYGVGDDRPASTFNPEVQYLAFVDRYNQVLLIDNIRSFFLHARDAKGKMANINKDKICLNFGTLKLELVNNYRPGVAKRVVADNEYTLYRISGYLARFLLDSYNADPAWRDGMKVIVNPISAKLGITWEAGPEVYLGTLPGTEMFLGHFQYYPLAFLILRIKRGEVPPQMASKALRQRVDGKLSAQWMTEDVQAVKTAVANVEALKPIFSGISATMSSFLSQFGIRM
ncbi:nucleocapsid protein [Witwatersrand virus]|uniref:Nucleoprotein n=1 Tax=Witwatersrand virus TaxID=1678231 RepID=A0A0R7FK72_9VIRU|nr:nucleocapsid protein [Witwatersrand virus]AKO90199.1 nucleocapsid protein [Witwatersrand virus]